MSDTEQNLTDPATPHKLMRARERGVVPRGLDLGYFVSLAALVAYASFSGPNLASRIAQASRGSLVAAPNVIANSNEILILIGGVFALVLGPLGLLVAAVFVTVLLAELVQTGVVFSTEPLRLDFGRLSPAKGFKRVFSLRMLIETGKNILKLGVYGAVAWMLIASVRDTNGAAITDGAGLADALRANGLRLLSWFLGVAAAFAILDQIIARQDFARRMRMSRRELRRELRDREGDPRLKQRRRSLHREFMQLSQSLKNIRGADVLVTNPAHYAVALRYAPGTMAAPRVVSRGSNRFALRLKRLAFIYGLVIVERPELARTLFRRCALDQPVPEDCYHRVADIYLSLRQTRRRKGVGLDV